ncbi:MAG: hypothetical protein LUF33_07730 [Clostridiales bacterium]|nr:hypothetical protein [Clostridiales bacterium]
MKKIKRILCALLSICMLSAPAVFSINANADDSVSSLQQELSVLEENSDEYQKILVHTQSDIEEKEEYTDALVNKIEVLDDKIALTRESIDDLNTSIGEKQDEIDEANENIEEQMDTLRSRIRTIYMAGNASDLEIILGAKGFSDFIDKMQLVKTLSNYDKELIDGIQEELDLISEQKAELEEDKKELEAQQTSLEEDQDELNELLEKNEETLRNLYSTSDDAETALQNAALESEEIESQIQEYYEEQAKAAREAAKKAAQSSSSSSSSSSYRSSSSSSSS